MLIGPASLFQQISLWIVVIAFALITPIGSIHIALSQEPPLAVNECKHKYAVCVVGAARSMDYTEVIASFNRSVVQQIGGCGNIFFYLFIGDELSDRGQRKLNKSRSQSMVKALQNATQVVMQYEENDFTCGQQSTGRFYKIAACADMVKKYEAENNFTHDVFILTRPDVRYFAPVPKSKDLPNSTGWFMEYVEGDLYAMSGDSGISIVANASAAECCEIESRQPPECFLADVPKMPKMPKQPRSNFIFHRYLSTHLHNIPKKGLFNTMLVRTPEMFHNGKTNKISEHGKYRPDVPRLEHPRIVEALHWKSMNQQQRIAWMEKQLV